MGFDYGNHHVFVGEKDAQIIRQAIIDCIHSISDRIYSSRTIALQKVVVNFTQNNILSMGNNT